MHQSEPNAAAGLRACQKTDPVVVADRAAAEMQTSKIIQTKVSIRTCQPRSLSTAGRRATANHVRAGIGGAGAVVLDPRF